MNRNWATADTSSSFVLKIMNLFKAGITIILSSVNLSPDRPSENKIRSIFTD